MAKIVRGFRRIGWVATVPVAGLALFVLFDGTKEFSASNYEVQPVQEYTRAELLEAVRTDYPEFRTASDDDLFAAIATDHPDLVRGITEPSTENVIGLPGIGYAYFSRDVPEDVVSTVVADFGKGHWTEAKPSGLQDKTTEVGPWTKYQRPIGLGFPKRWRLIVFKRVNTLRLAGLIVASIGITALTIQGLISVVAWVARGFKDSVSPNAKLH